MFREGPREGSHAAVTETRALQPRRFRQLQAIEIRLGDRQAAGEPNNIAAGDTQAPELRIASRALPLRAPNDHAMLKTETTERRRVQRLHILEPLPGKIRGRSVYILDLSLRGVRVAHNEILGPVGEECELSFEWEGATVILECRIRRSAVQRVGKASYARTLYHSGLEIRSTRSNEVLRQLVESHVKKAIEDAKAKARDQE